jgi:hypothetical protein
MSCAVRVGTSQQFLGPAFGEHVATVGPPQGLASVFLSPGLMFDASKEYFVALDNQPEAT